MMKKIIVLVIMSLVVLIGCGQEDSCNVVLGESHGTITAEEVSAAVVDSTSDSSEGCAIVPSVGGQLLKLAYMEYSKRGCTEIELDQLPTSMFSINLAKLYRDVMVAVE